LKRNHDDIAEELRTLPFRVEGRMPWSSNATFLVSIGHQVEPYPETDPAGSTADSTADSDLDDDDYEDENDSDGYEDEENDGDEDDDSGSAGGLPAIPPGAHRGIYKPGRGERPLWDFPRGLFRREIAAYELSELLGWGLIPPTVLRDADYGPGSVQWFIDTDYTKHYFTLLEDSAHHDQLRRMALFDIVANNTDRKGGHVLLDAHGALWGIDNGLCFNEEPKLRTVIWDFAGETLPEGLCTDLAALVKRNPKQLGSLNNLLSSDEIAALFARARRLLERPEFPAPRSDHAYPWPLV
jgi:uncharacterized repeat protein (TIGR03843 family)